MEDTDISLSCKYAMFRAPNHLGRWAPRFIMLALLLFVPYLSPTGSLLDPVKAQSTTALSVWSPDYGSRAVVNSSIPQDTFLNFRVNVTGGERLNGFDITVSWNPTILNGENVTQKGGIFDLPEFRFLTREATTDHVRMDGFLLGAIVQGNGTIITFTVKVVGIASTTLDVSSSLLLSPSRVPYVPFNGFFSNMPNTGDLILTSVVLSNRTVNLGDPVEIRVGVRNMGSIPMANVEVQVTANNTLPINSTMLGTMPGDTFQMPVIVWNTTGLSAGLYIINATVTTSSQDAFTGDNSLSLERVRLVIHDLAVVSLRAAAKSVKINRTIDIRVGVKNLGTVRDLATVSVLANTTLVRVSITNQTHLPVSVDPGANQTVVFTWNTTGLDFGTYFLTAKVAQIPGDVNATNNNLSTGSVKVCSPPDVICFEHDLAIVYSGIPGPGDSILIGVKRNLTITVENVGVFDENYTLSFLLKDQSSNQTQAVFETGPIPVYTGTNVTFSYIWDTGSVQPATYELKARANVTSSSDEDDSNNQVSTSFTVKFKRAPNAVLVITPSLPATGALVLFNATGSGDPETGFGYRVLTMLWDFGDQTPVQACPFTLGQQCLIVTHSYATAGTYAVKLTAVSNCDYVGCSATTTISLRVNARPVASFNFASPTPIAGEEVSFDANTSADSDGSVISYSWDFGDGTTATGRTVKHTYSQPGTYSVKLTVTDNEGATHERTITLTVGQRPLIPMELLIVIIAGGGAGAAAGGWFLRSRRRRTRLVSPSGRA